MEPERLEEIEHALTQKFERIERVLRWAERIQTHFQDCNGCDECKWGELRNLFAPMSAEELRE